MAYGNKKWGALPLGYRYGQCGAKFRTATEFAQGDKFGTPCVTTGWWPTGERRAQRFQQQLLFNAFWRPEESGWMPSISAGVGLWLVGNDDWEDNTNKRAMATWMVGLTWNDVFLEGNALGFAVGQPQFTYVVENDDFVADGGYAMELW